MKPDVVTTWHEAVAKHDLTAFEALVADDAVFESPALHKPQAGKAKVSLYLRAALTILDNGTFRYTNEWQAPRSAVLEFESVIDGLVVNGVDIIRWNDEGQVIGFKVMVRPFKALTALMTAMQKVLEAAA